MEQTKNIIGLDCGNSSFRIVLGRYDGSSIKMEVVDQYPNDMVQVGEYFYWDFLRIFDGFKKSLKKALSMVSRIDSIGICTWGVDFGLYDVHGNMVSNPLSYRNTLGGEQLERLSPQQKEELFLGTGILCDKINSVYLMAGLREQMPELYSVADKLLMVPDILNYMLTGVMANELSELSTTQLLDANSRKPSAAACAVFNIPQSIFSPILQHGTALGYLRAELAEELGIDYKIPIVCVPSHDTASAVLAIPAKEKNFAFISSGTWSLIGTELDEPIVTKAVMNAGLTNEVGAFEKITLLKNSAGMFIIQRLKKEYEQAMGRTAEWSELDELADKASEKKPLLFNCNSPRFFNPPKMGDAIREYLHETKQDCEQQDWGNLIRAVYESMACSYADTVEQLELATGKHFAKIYIVGGGSKNKAVNALTACHTGKTVVACGKESTSLGCIATQLKYFEPTLNIDDIRGIIANSIDILEYNAKPNDGELVKKYRLLP